MSGQAAPDLLRGASPPRSPRHAAAPPRRPFRDNPLLVLLGIFAAGGRAGRHDDCWLNRSSRFAPDFLSEFVLYALSVVDLTMLVALRVRAGPQRHQDAGRAAAGAAVRAVPGEAGRRCCSAMTLIPAVLVLLVGQRAHPQQRRPLVQRADGRDARVGPADRERLLPRARSGR
ncbi:MAG: hypothetical protein MZW92_53845 [Comamonadaceae bacterium]|nr:hypothetical protein [Comamonadaceae bacterium]